MSRIFLFFICLSLFTSCKTAHFSKLERAYSQGFLIQDAQSGKVLLAKNEHQLFTPASNTKILTLYASLANIQDSLEAFKYQIKDKDIYIKPSADPSFLHPNLPESEVVDFLRPFSSIYVAWQQDHIPNFGKGWMWDDTGEAFQTEVSTFPVHGNLLNISHHNLQRFIQPAYLNFLAPDQIYLPQKVQQTQDSLFKFNVPFKVIWNNHRVLEEVLQNPRIGSELLDPELPIFSKKSIKKDTVLRKMMYDSDNFMAEHLLLQSSLRYGHNLSTELVIDELTKNDFASFPDAFRWVDGSGISRYNLNSPANFVSLLQLLKTNYADQNVFSFFPANTIDGTLKSVLKEYPGVLRAKSGSMSGVYCLSGYMTTKKGRELIFSIMNNDFVKPVSEVRDDTSALLKEIYLRF